MRGVPLSLIELEFTESAAMEVSETVLTEIAALRHDGATIAIDDFGTGYSNIARLRAMPLDRVKLDPSLIADIESSEKARVIVQAVIQLIKGVGAKLSPRRSRPSPRPISCARWAATPSRALFSPSRCSRMNSSTWTGNADRGVAKSVA